MTYCPGWNKTNYSPHFPIQKFSLPTTFLPHIKLPSPVQPSTTTLASSSSLHLKSQTSYPLTSLSGTLYTLSTLTRNSSLKPITWHGAAFKVCNMDIWGRWAPPQAKGWTLFLARSLWSGIMPWVWLSSFFCATSDNLLQVFDTTNNQVGFAFT